MSDARELIHRGRTRLLSVHFFYGYLCCSLKLRETTNIPTMATDGVHLFFNPDFVMGLTKTQLVAGLAHETEHVFLKHFARAEGIPEENRPIAMVAADMAINPHLKDGGFDLIPATVYPPKEHWNESFEEHYKRLLKTAKRIQLPALGGTCSGILPRKGMSPAEIEESDNRIQVAIMNAADQARAAGNLPADIERMVAKMRAPKVSWIDVVRRFMMSPAKNDYRMTPPNRRYVYQGIYLPSLKSETVGDVLFILDGSGSTMNVFDQFMAEFISMFTDVRPDRLHTMVWDTRCSWYRELSRYDDESESTLRGLKGEMGAGGGTDFTHCFKYFAEKIGITPNIAIVLTDMEMCGWPDDPGFPVMWIATTDIIGPFGETVRIEAHEA